MTKYCLGLFTLVLLVGVLSMPQTGKEAVAIGFVPLVNLVSDKSMSQEAVDETMAYVYSLMPESGLDLCFTPAPCTIASIYFPCETPSTCAGCHALCRQLAKQVQVGCYDNPDCTNQVCDDSFDASVACCADKYWECVG